MGKVETTLKPDGETYVSCCQLSSLKKQKKITQPRTTYYQSKGSPHSTSLAVLSLRIHLIFT